MESRIKITLPSGTPLIIDLNDEYLSWEIIESNEREMGLERLHEAILEKEVESESELVVITLHIWEYPEGALNCQEITVEGGELDEECDLGHYLLSYDDDES